MLTTARDVRDKGVEEIGVSLTENMTMNPEASVSALVFHHPDCTFFSAADDRIRPCSGADAPRC